MSPATTNQESCEVPPEHLDVLIVGAGLSGVGAACHLQQECPDRTFAIVEARPASGGTWDLFRYPGIRSDSDMFTLGYRFQPWREPESLADGPSILRYVRETASEHGLDQKIRYNRRVVRASFSSQTARWTVDVEHAESKDVERLTCSFLCCNTGYYRYDEGFTPEFEGTERFGGTIVHPQHWPEDLDYAGKRVVVIGSGATAVTLVPAMAEEAAHVTMVQRSPSYVLSVPGSDPIAGALRKKLPPHLLYPLIRWKNVAIVTLLYKVSRRWPQAMRRLLRKGAAARLPEGYDVDTHFNPTYDPWDQRMCFVPDGDLFAALADGSASVVTDRIESFTERGLRLQSGRELEADVIITATGLNLLVLGGISLSVDGVEVDPAETVGYKDMMLSGVPNLAMTVGYTNASWTLKADLVHGYVCRLLNHMRDRGMQIATPALPPDAVGRRPFLDLQSGYVARALDVMPKQGDRAPWCLHQNYFRDVRALRHGALEDEGIAFTRAAGEAPGQAPERALAAA
ncbi:MAG TPA: NAD(P)/FAD-dependent oxidoreductase [Solirubrobacteraceae bacterium]|nr:NAD(P)/FAD-dependent oxidoreductase [Solirubrobacteraceae bacterium]